MMKFQNLQHILLVVLTGNGQHDALFLKVQHMFLEIAESEAGEIVADFDAPQTVFADDPAPHGVVGVQNDTFFSADFPAGKNAGQNLADLQAELLCIGLAVEIPFARVVRGVRSSNG